MDRPTEKLNIGLTVNNLSGNSKSSRLWWFRCLLFIVVCSIFNAFFNTPSEARQQVRLLLTSNIQGRAVLDVENQEAKDPLLVLAQSLLAEKENGVDLLLDLGNGFYPGVLSKFSSGSIMMDFFDFFDFAGTLISSRDLQIGLENLEFLQKNKSARLISANLVRSDKPVFTPYIVRTIGGVPVAFIGLSSKSIEIDVAEEALYDMSQKSEKKVLAALLDTLHAEGIEHIVLLSGLKLSRTMRLVQSHSQIDLALCGGDYSGAFYGGKITRIDLNDSRSVVILDSDIDYYLLDLDLSDGISLSAVRPKKARAQQRSEDGYIAFRDRLTLWKRKYLDDQSQQIALTDDKEYLLDDQRLLQLLRDNFNSEIAVVDTMTINPYPIRKDIDQSDLLHLVNLDYKIFTFTLNGDQLAQVVSQKKYNLQVAGVTGSKKLRVQGYPVDKDRNYSFAATQSAYKKIRRILGKKIEYSNSWKTVTDLLIDDLAGEQVILRDDYAYLEKRFRTLLDIYLSNFISSASVKRGDNIETPVAQPSDGYSKWGLEDRIDLTIYNQMHRFVFTPLIQYARQDEDYIQNLFRIISLYEYNLRDNIKPYNKFQYDTVVETVDGERPVLIRETIGGSLYGDYFAGKIGLGFEKKVRDPSEDALYGLETILNFKYPFLNYFTYILNVDNFISSSDPEDSDWGLRSEIDNIVTAKLNSYLSLSLKYKYFYLYEVDLKEEYHSSQIFTTLDLTTDWKYW